MTIPRGTRPTGPWSDSDLEIPRPRTPWVASDPMGVGGVEYLHAHLAARQRAAGYAELDRLAEVGSLVEPHPIHRRGRALLLGALAGALLAGAAWYGAYGAEINPMIASANEAEVCASDGLPGSAYSRTHRVVKRKPVPGMVIDHIVPLCAGGADNDANIQLQRLGESMDKDDLERAVCIAVCRKHTMTLAEGQAIFLGNWRAHLRGPASDLRKELN